jgi:hypothetical protein
MRRFPIVPRVLGVALLAALTMGGECDDDDDGPLGPDGGTFEATLTGAAERPDPVTTDATGSATVEVDEDGNFEVEVEDITDVTMAHIHVGDANTAGPVVVTLFNTGTPESFTDRETLAEGTFTEADITPAGGVTTMDDLLAAMEAGNTYVNVHTSANPTGEIRGQLDD